MTMTSIMMSLIRLLIAEIRRSRQELFESLSLYYRVFIKKEDVSELLDEEDGE